MRAGVFNAAGSDAQQRAKKLDPFVAARSIEREPELAKSAWAREVADGQNKVQPGPASDLFVELLADRQLGQAARQRHAHYSFLFDRDQSLTDQQASHHRAEQVAQQVIDIER